MTTVSASSASAPEVIAVDSHVTGVQCNGGGGALGHPVVYYAFDGEPSVTCQYCGRIFVKK